MDKSGVFGEALEQLGGVVKKAGAQVVKAPLDIGKGTLEQVIGAGGETQQTVTGEKDLASLRIKEEEEKAKNLAIMRQRLAEMMVPKRQAEPRPSERIVIQEQQKQEVLAQKRAKQPPPLSVEKAKGTREKLPGVSG